MKSGKGARRNTNHGKRNTPVVMRMSQRHRVMLGQKQNYEKLESCEQHQVELLKRVDNLAAQHNKLVLEVRGLTSLFLSTGHTHPQGRVVLLGNTAARAVPISQEDLAAAIQGVLERAIAAARELKELQEAAPSDGQHDDGSDVAETKHSEGAAG